jgi:hypothetical protein
VAFSAWDELAELSGPRVVEHDRSQGWGNLSRPQAAISVGRGAAISVGCRAATSCRWGR